ncbi:hypothetical protein AB3N60_05325 [Leptospira sp. WS39.C2]
MKLYFRLFLLLVVFFSTSVCIKPDLENGCDPRSKSYFTHFLVKNLANDQSASCVPYVDRSVSNFVSYGVFTFGSPAEVVTAAITRGKIYIAGLFDQIAATTGGGAFVWSETAKPVASTYCPQLDVFDETVSTYGTINQAVVDPEGNLYVLGKFTHIQGYPRRNLAKISPNCKLDQRFNANLNVSSTVFYDLIYLDGRIFFSGDFQTSNGAITNVPTTTFREHVASVNAITGLIDDWSPNVTGTDVRCMTTDGTFIYIGGGFTAVNSNGAGNIGKLHKDNGSTFYGMVDTNGTVNAIEVKDGILYVGGIFSSLNGGSFPRSKLAAIDLSTNTVTSIFSTLVISGNAVFDLKIYNDQLFVAGEISTPRPGIFKIDLLGNLQSSNYLLDGFSTNAYRLSIIDDKLFVFGTFETVQTLDRKYFFQVDIPSDKVTSFNPKLFNPNYDFQGIALKMKDQVIFLGGGFGSIDTSTRNYLVELDLYTGLPTDWEPNPNDMVTSLIATDNRLYLHGQFSLIDNTIRQSTAAYDLDTKSLLSWNPIFPAASIETMLYYQNSIYAAGNFTAVNSAPVNRIVKLDANSSSFDSSFASIPDATVRSLQIWNDELYIAGQFTTIPNASLHLAKLNPQTGSFIKTHTDSFSSNFSAYSIFVSDNRLIMSGQYQTTSPFTGNGLSFYSLPELTSIQTNGTLGTVSEFARTIDQNEDQIFLGGFIDNVAGQSRNGIFSLDRKSLTLNPWNPNFESGTGVRKIIYHQNAVYAFGNINNPNKRYRVGLVKIDPISANLY